MLPALVARVRTRPRPAPTGLTRPVRRPRRAVHLPGQALHRAPPERRPTARIWTEDPDTGERRDLTGEEDRAFWTWAAIETLRHTGIRIEELTELSHHSLIQYTLPPAPN